MIKKRKSQEGLEELHEVKYAGFTATKKIKRDKSVNRRAGLHDKLKNLQGEVRVKRRKPLELKHVRRMRKFAAVAAVGVVGAIAVVGVGFLSPSKILPVDDVGNPTVCFEVPTDGSKPTDHTLVENVGYLNYVLKSQSYWSSQSRTDVDAAVFGVHADQYVINYKQYYNDVLISVDCSFSGVSQSLQYGEQFCQVNDAVLSRYSTSTKTEDLNKGLDAPWSTDEANGMKLGAFRENRGLPPYDFSVYVLNEKTIANAQDYSVIDNGDGTYTMSLTLNTNTGDNETSADYYYRIQMQANGGLNEKPTIYSTTLTYTFDESWRVLKLEVDDSYTAKAMGMNTNCTSHTVTNYYYEEELAKNTFWEDYFQEEYERVKDDLSDGGVIDKEEAPSAMGYLANAFGSVLAEGAIFKVDLNIDNLDLNGVVCVEMTDGLGLTAKLGDILVWLDGNDLYINDGASKYKLNTSGLLSSGEESEEEGGLLGGFDLTSLMDQMTAGEFVVNEETGVATLTCEVELFGFKIPMEFEFQKTENGVELNFLKAEIPLGEKVVKAKLCFGTESDKPAIPEDTATYQDILNDGVTLNISLNLNGLALDGKAKIIMDNGAFAGVYANLGDITVYYDCPHNMLYLSAGDVKYKLDISALGTGDANTLALSDAFDIKSLLTQIIANLSTSETSVGTSINIDALGSVLKAALNIQLAGGLKVDANLSLDELDLSLSAALTNEQVTLPDLTGYQDILNDGVTLNISLNLNGLTLDGKAKIIMDNGAFAGIYADLGDITVYFDCPHNMLYLSTGDVKYKLDISALGTGDANTLALSDAFDIKSLLSEVIKNLSTSETSVGTSIKIDALGSVLKAALNIQLAGGLKVDANLSLDELDLSLSAALTNEQATLPDLTGYQDILNTEITLDVNLTLLTGLTDEQTGKRDEAVLDGKVALCLADGAVAEIRADFGGLAIYFDFAANSLYVKVGTTKVMLNLDGMDFTDVALLSSFGDGELITADLPDAIKQFITNLIGEGKIISTNADLSLLNALIPVWAELDLSDGLSVRAGLSLLGIDAVAKVAFSETSLEGLSDEEKEEYVDVLKEGHKIVESLIGNHISATVTGTQYSYEEKYAEFDSVKYTFKATVEFENGTVTVNDDGIEVDSNIYLHLNIGLTAKHPADDSLYLDVVLMDANPVTGSNGKTTGGYYKDGSLDVYLSVSKYEQSSNALQIYAPVNEILTLVSMLGATANLKGMTFEGNEELKASVAQIATLLDGMLISNYLPKSVQYKFASLGDSLIPQILGVSLEELLNKLFGDVDSTVKEVEKADFLLSDKYVSSIRTTDESLIFVLDSKLIYNDDNIDAADDLTVTFNRVLKDGVYFVGGASLENVFFGENRVNKLNLGLTLGYDEIVRPDADSAFENYFNADGLDTLVNGLINSATHKVDGTEDEYDLNHYYLLNGNVTAGIKVLLTEINVTIQIKSLAVYIDEETNKVSIDAHIYYDGVQEVNQVAINGDTDVYLSVRDGRISIRRIQYTRWEKSGLITSEVDNKPAAVEAREMSLKEFSDNMMDNIVFIFNFGSLITKNLENADSSENKGVSFEGKDYGECLNTVISSYLFEENSAGANWTVALQGGLIKAYTGMTTSNIPVKFRADLNEDGTYTVKSLDILQTTMQLFGSAVTLNLKGGLTYCNPNEQMGEGFKDSSCNLYNTQVTVTSEYGLADTESSFKKACGSQVKLPLGVTTRVNGYSYILDGYTQTTQIGGTTNITFEGYVEENGVRYGLVTLTGDTEYTAIWNTAYTVTFTDEDGNILYSVIYRENEVLNFGNMPECPEIDGYTVQWVSENGTAANGTAVTGDGSFKLEYVKTPLKVTFNSLVDFNYTGYDGTYKVLNVGFEEGSSYILAETTAEGYSFAGWWYNDNGNWRKITSVEEFADQTSVTLEALWLKAEISGAGYRKSYKVAIVWTKYSYTHVGTVKYELVGNDELLGAVNGVTRDNCYVHGYYEGGSYTHDFYAKDGNGTQYKDYEIEFNTDGYNTDTDKDKNRPTVWYIVAEFTIDVNGTQVNCSAQGDVCGYTDVK